MSSVQLEAKYSKIRNSLKTEYPKAAGSRQHDSFRTASHRRLRGAEVPTESEVTEQPRSGRTVGQHDVQRLAGSQSALVPGFRTQSGMETATGARAT